MATDQMSAAPTNDGREIGVDRLTRIDGIALKTAQALVEAGIHGYDDLARYLSQHTAQQVSAALREHGVNRPPAFIDRAGWIRQAREFDDLETLAPAPVQEEADLADEPPGEIAPDVEPKADASAVLVEPDGTRLEIGGVQLSVVEPAARRPEKRLQAEIRFQLSGSEAETLTAKGIAFRIEGYTVDVERGFSELVVTHQSRLEPQVFNYRDRQEFRIPDVGRYEFHSLVLLLPPGDLAAYHRGPSIRVVP